MASDIEQLKARRSAILLELKNLTSSSAGGKPDYSINGQSVNHTAYKKSLYDELKAIGELLKDGLLEEDADTTFEVISEVVT